MVTEVLCSTDSERLGKFSIDYVCSSVQDAFSTQGRGYQKRTDGFYENAKSY